MATTPEDNTNALLRSIVAKQKDLIDKQNHRMSAYIAVIEMVSALCKSKGIEVPLDGIASLLAASNEDERTSILIAYKTKLIHEVLDEFEEEVQRYEQAQHQAAEDNWSSPEWDDGMHSPFPSEPSIADITEWKTFSRKWRLFGDVD